MKKLLGVIFIFIVSVNLLFADNESYKLSGDVRVKSQSNWEQGYDHYLKCEATVGLNFNFPETWMQTKLKMSNTYETPEFSLIQLEIQQLLIGYSISAGDNHSFFMEVGRNKLENLFESKIQYDNHFNGLHLSYNIENPHGNVTIHGGPHIINSDLDHYGFIGEIIVKNPLTSNFTLKYSLTDWLDTKDSSPDYQYLISQALIKYQIDENLGIYGAYLINHKATNSFRGFYLGMSYGNVSKANDWMIDFNYQNLQSSAIPNFDTSGIGTGMQLKSAYAMTDNFSIQGKINTKKYMEIAAIYKW